MVIKNNQRLFDVVGSLGIIFILSPLLIYISYKVKRTVDLQYMDMRELGRMGNRLNV